MSRLTNAATSNQATRESPDLWQLTHFVRVGSEKEERLLSAMVDPQKGLIQINLEQPWS